jgi:hypothetical protein
MKRFAVFVLATSIIITACLPFQVASPTATLPVPQLTIVTSIPLTLTPSPTPTPTTEEWIYPYTIEGLREHEYKSGEINIGAVLAETDLYTRYAIDYPSDGLTITGIMQVPKM